MNSLALLSLPVLGAVIGYLTNHIAIRMLFRPLRPWRILGRRLPLTPGVIPAARHRLARNIGSMVGEHLLTPEDLRRALSQDDFQRNLSLLIQAQTEAVFQTRLGPPATVVPEAFRSYFKVGIKILRWRFLKQLHNHLDSAEFAAVFNQTSDEHLDEILSRKLGDIVPEEQRRELLAGLERQIGQLLASPAFAQGLEKYLATKLEEFASADGRIADLLPPPLLNSLLDRLEEQAAPLLDQLALILEKPEARDKIATTLSRALQKFAVNTGPLGAMLAGILPPETLAEKIRLWLNEKGREAGGWLLDEEARREIVAALRREAENFCRRPWRELLAGLSAEQLAQIRPALARNLGKLAARPESAAAFGTLLRDAVEAHLDQPLKTIGEKIWPAREREQGRHWTRDELLRLLRSRRVKRLLDQLLTEMVEEKLLAPAIGRLADLLPREVQSGINSYLQAQINQLLEREVPPLIEVLNIREMVARKIDGLDILHLEGLLLSIMQDQFKYINLFGALIGFIIGLLNLLFIVTF